jgi:DNA end-binding protein Ku
MRPLWKGSISFGLVNIPVSLYPGTQHKATVDMDMLRDSDHSKIHYKRVAEADGKEVPYEHIVKGYEYEKGKYVVLEPEDYARVQIKSNQTVDIREFVNLEEIEPQYFDTPYYLEPDRGGAKAYQLLRRVLVETGLAGIAKVVIRPPREHLAVVKPFNDILMVETMHFADELRSPKDVKAPSAAVGEKELNMARTLVRSMEAKWEPDKWNDEYRECLMKLIEEKVQSGGKTPKGQRKPAEKTGKIVDLVSLLQESLSAAQKAPEKGKRVKQSPAARHRKGRQKVA